MDGMPEQGSMRRGGGGGGHGIVGAYVAREGREVLTTSGFETRRLEPYLDDHMRIQQLLDEETMEATRGVAVGSG